MGNEMRERSEKDASTQCSGLYCCASRARRSCSGLRLPMQLQMSMGIELHPDLRRDRRGYERIGRTCRWVEWFAVVIDFDDDDGGHRLRRGHGMERGAYGEARSGRSG